MSFGWKEVRVKGKTYRYRRDYAKEYATRTPQQKKNRQTRREARSKMIDRYGKSALNGKDVDHKKGIKAGNGYHNLRLQSPKANRARKSKYWR